MRTRRTKNQIEKDRYNKDVDAYNFYVVNLDTKRAETGFQFREDAVDLLNDYDDKKKYKVVSKRALKTMGIENPNESFKYIKGGNIKNEIAFKIQNDYIGYLDLGFYNIPLSEDYVAYNSFFTLSDATKELFDYLKSDDGIALCKYNPKSNFSILKLYPSGKKDYRGDNEIIDKTVFKISAKEVDNLRSIRRLEFGGDFQSGVYAGGGYFDGSIPEVSTYMTNYAKGGSLEAHGIEVGDTFVKTISGGIQKVKDKNGKIVYINLSTGERDAQPPLPFAMGGYTDFSKSKPEVLNENKMLEYDVEVPEIDIEKIRTIDLNIDNNKILSLDDSIRVLKQIYDKGSINAYEEVKILFLDNSNKVIGIYNHSKGGITGTVIDVEMVCALALKCLAKGVIMSHNHPSGSLRFSDADIKVSKELKNALNLFRIALLDSIVITENGFTSMTNEGIFANGGSLSRFDNGGDLGMSISTKFKNYVSNHTISESFLYNNRMLSSREITPQQYELNRDYILARRSERGFAEGGGVGIEEEIDLTDDNRLRVKDLTYEYKKPTSKELAEKYNSGAYEFMEQDKMMSGGAIERKYNSMSKDAKEELMREKIGVGRTPFSEYEKYSQLSSHHKYLVDKNLG